MSVRAQNPLTFMPADRARQGGAGNGAAWAWAPHLPAAPVGSNVFASAFSNGTHRLVLLVNTTWKTQPGTTQARQRQQGGQQEQAGATVTLRVPCSFAEGREEETESRGGSAWAR